MQDHLSKPITIAALRDVLQTYSHAGGVRADDAIPFKASSRLAQQFADTTDRLIARIETVIGIGELNQETADELQDELDKFAGIATLFDEAGLGEVAVELAEILARLPFSEKLPFLKGGITRLRKSNLAVSSAPPCT